MKTSILAYLMAMLLSVDNAALVAEPVQILEQPVQQPSIALCVGADDGMATLVQMDGEKKTVPNHAGAAVCSVVRLSTDGELEVARTLSNLKGVFDWDAHMLGDAPLSPDVRILDTYYTGDFTKCCAKMISDPARLHGKELGADTIRHMEMDADGVITDLLLKNVTGDLYTYGVVTETDYFDSSPAIYTYKILSGNKETEYKMKGKRQEYNKRPSVLKGDVVGAMIIDGTMYEIRPLKVKKIALDGRSADGAEIIRKTILREIPSFHPGNVALMDDDASLEIYYNREPDDGGLPRVIVVYHAFETH